MIRKLGERLFHAVAAYRDYRHARGFQHKKQLSKLGSKLEDAIGGLEDEQDDLRRRIKKQKTYILDDARTKAFKALMRDELTSVRGIGDTLAGRIRRHRRITDLSSLQNYAGRVKGVGDDKASTLYYWASRKSDWVEDRAEELAEESAKYEDRRNKMEELRRQVEELDEEKNDLRELKRQLESVLDTLESVSAKTLYRARVNGESDSIEFEAIDRYFRGVYGEWEKPPGWLMEIQEVAPDA